MLIQAPRGTKDILPDDQKYFQFILKTIEKQADINGFSRIDTPIMEYESIFTKSLGQDSDIVEKEIFEVKRLSKDLNNEKDEKDEKNKKEKLILRPEGTAGIARAYIEHGMRTWPQPVQLYYVGPMFRYNRPQKGRLRQFWQFGFEVIGADDPATDARVISFAYSLYRALRLSDVSILVNSIGCLNCQPNIKQYLQDYFSKKKAVLCEDCKRRLDTNPFRILDCKNRHCQKLNKSLSPLVDHLCEPCKDHFKQVLEFLDEAGVPYDLEPRLVRGLDYYTRTTFEIVSKNDTTRQNSLGGGGRYNDLIKLFGEKQTPAIGMAFGIERIIDLLKSKKIKLEETEKPLVFIAQLGEKAKKRAILLLEMFQNEGIISRASLTCNALKPQLTAADKLNVPIMIIIGQREVIDGTAIIRDMNEGIQEVVEEEEILDRVKRKLKIKA